MNEKQIEALEFIKNSIGDGYIYGATGWICTPKRVEEQCKQYPNHEKNIRKYGLGKWLNKKCFDCAQFTRATAKKLGYDLPSGSNSQFKKFNWSKKYKAKENPIPKDIPFLFVFRVDEKGTAQHVGVTDGKGNVVDARSHAKGVVIDKIENYKWTDYAILSYETQTKPLIDFEVVFTEEENENIIVIFDNINYNLFDYKFTVLLGSRGGAVRNLQKILFNLGYGLNSDGVFGLKTFEAVKKYQKNSGLIIDGRVGVKTWESLKIDYGFKMLENYCKLTEQEIPLINVEKPVKVYLYKEGE